MLLYTFVLSHFSEKARWALDYEGIAYEERRLVPGPHVFTVRRMAKDTTVPILRHEHDMVQGSSAILDYLHRELGASRLAPAERDAARSAELEARLDHAIGLGVQRIFYGALLGDRETVVDLWAQDGPPWARWFYALAYPAMAMVVKRRYTIAPDAIDRARERFRKAADTVDELLRARPYLNGESPGRVDITLAALFAPVCRPPGHLVHWPELTEPLRTFVREFENRPIWEHVLRMYRDHRKPAPARAA